ARPAWCASYGGCTPHNRHACHRAPQGREDFARHNGGRDAERNRGGQACGIRRANSGYPTHVASRPCHPGAPHRTGLNCAERRPLKASAAELIVSHGSYPGAIPYLKDSARWCAYVRDAILEPAIGRDILALAPVCKPALLRQVFGECASSPAQIVSGFSKVRGAPGPSRSRQERSAPPCERVGVIEPYDRRAFDVRLGHWSRLGTIRRVP